MDRLVPDVQEEGRRALPLDEIDGPIREDVRDVAFHRVDTAVFVQLRIGGSSLAGNGDPLVPSGSRRGVVAHVPLAEKRRLVAVGL